MKRTALWAAITLATVATPAWSEEPTVAELMARMDQYEAQIQQLEQRIQQAEQRADEAEFELARAKPATATQTTVAAAAPAVAPQIDTQQAAVRHYDDRASTPHSEGSFTNAWNIPGTDSFVAIGGYVKADFIQDFDYIGTMTNSRPMILPSTARRTRTSTVRPPSTPRKAASISISINRPIWVCCAPSLKAISTAATAP